MSGSILEARIAAIEARRQEEDSKYAAVARTKHDFINKMFCTTVAVMASDAVFHWLCCIFTSDFGGITSEESLICRLLYVMLVTALVPVVQFYGTPVAHGGHSWWRDVLGLVVNCQGMGLSWGFRDMIKELSVYDWRIHPGVQLFALAFGLQMVMSAWECTPWFVGAEARCKAGEDTLYLRAMMVATQTRLAIGFAWNQVFRHPIKSNLRTGHAGILLVQLVYTMLVIAGVTIATTKNTIDNAEHEKAVAKKGNAEASFYNTHSPKLTSWNLFVGALAFVFAWSINDVLNDLVFGVYGECLTSTESPKTCSYKLNLVYACCIMSIFSWAAGSLQGQRSNFIIRFFIKFGAPRAHAETAAAVNTTLIVNAMSLVVGWSWSNTVGRVVIELTDHIVNTNGMLLSGRSMVDAALFNTLSTLIAVLATGSIYHSLKEDNRSVEDLIAERALLSRNGGCPSCGQQSCFCIGPRWLEPRLSASRVHPEMEAASDLPECASVEFSRVEELGNADSTDSSESCAPRGLPPIRTPTLLHGSSNDHASYVAPAVGRQNSGT